MLTIWGRANSANVQKPMWLIAELGLEHERIDVGGPFGGLDQPDFLAMNPNKLIPVMQDGDLVLWESHAILRYIAEIYGNDALWPVDAEARARIDMWIEWSSSSWIPAMTQLFMGIIRTPADKRDKATLERVYGAVTIAAKRADSQLATHPHIATDRMTLADIAFGTLLYRYFTLEIERPDMPNLERYYTALTERNAYRTHVMINYDGLRVPGAERP
ncbi:MAG: glutathione S-transferase family protein [Rhodobacteraceae bacterium]|nr:glutathione S-transferase family protein [Paracoccaceae bacterium]